MPDPTTTPDPLIPTPEVTEPEAPRQPKKTAERIADLEQQIAELREQAAAPRPAPSLAHDAGAVRLSELTERLAAIEAAMQRPAEDVQKAIDTTPARQVGNLMLDDRMSEAEILERVRAIRSGKLAPDKATRFRTDARIYPDAGTPLHAKHAGTTIPLRTEVTRADFSPESLDQHIATGALIPIA
jgi:DNA-binding transcriptional MerR regulator